MAFATTITADIAAPISKAFALAAPVDLPTVMRSSGPIPGVARVTDQTGAWDGAGQSRRIHLTDGSSVHEELTAYEKDRSFSYRVSDFSGPVGALFKEANGHWEFEPLSDNSTRIHWTYAYTQSSPLTAPLVWFFVNALWKGHITRALARIKDIVEHSPDVSESKSA